MVYSYSKGIPRLINAVCDLAMLGGYAVQRMQLGPDQVRKALDRIPAYPDAMRNMANLHLDKGENAKAVPYLSHLLKINPRDVKARLGAASAFETLGRVDAAISMLAPLLTLKSTQQDALDRMSRILSGTVSSGGVGEAVVLAETACRPVPELFPELMDALSAS